ncbi:hypothetical protein [Paracoccus sp. SCSIO 75233]|uniref:hypothetical protein n=1 Tax=Paracoccus sp. SCSIO 75233 TaxID=3017782 RepID=UPI0022F11F40|nr:hypothetical protein [Paracoccus sp. SCSIO 75233]WBU55375.1 hypothetical protein PAF12_18695 [Paracoccus sp. SCSIO 75233]
MENPMPRMVAKIYIDDIDVDRRLAELGMDRQDILDIRDVAASMHATGSSPLFPANGAGQLAYQYGTRELRATFLKRGWVIDQSYGTNGVRHPDRKVIVLYQNVDVACSLSDLPQARSRKGAGSERLSQGSAFDLIEEVVPATHSGEGLDVEVWYVMVAQDGAVEVTHALIKGGEFSEFIERIFVHDGSDFDALEEDGSSDDDAIDFDIKISRK